MKTAFRTPLALVLLTAFAAAAQAQQPPAAAKAPPKPGPGLVCPDALHGAVHEQIQAPAGKESTGWRLLPPQPGKKAHLFAEMSVEYPKGEAQPGTITCKYQDLDTVLSAITPKCPLKYVGAWSDGNNIGATRVITKTPGPAVCKAAAAAAPKPGTGRELTKPTVPVAVTCAVECAPGK